MYFTQDDYKKIESWLSKRTVKDSDFPTADPVRNSDLLPIVQDGKNKILPWKDFMNNISIWESPDFYNISKKHELFCIDFIDAINSVPIKKRKLGLVITFLNKKGNWEVWQFKGRSLNQWSDRNNWTNTIREALDDLIFYPDEEDITGVQIDNKSYLKLKDRLYRPSEFSGMGQKILRKNLVGAPTCSIDDEDHYVNLLTNADLQEENTVYIIRYDFDLDGRVLTIPKGCTLWFQGGTLNNGSVLLQETALLGVFEFKDLGNVSLMGTFNTGQIMTFLNTEYMKKVGNLYVMCTRPSSATEAEDPRQDSEVTHRENPDAYNVEERQELRWWNGEEWILILDITDYTELKSIIQNVVDRFNVEISATYKYFKRRIHEIEVDIDVIETNITNINSVIENLENITQSFQEFINNIESLIKNYIEEYISNININEGVSSVTVNGEKFLPDDTGNITLPDYPSSGNVGPAPSVVGTLTINTHDGIKLGDYNGSEDKIITLPELGGSGGGTTIIDAKETLTVKYGDTVLGTYTGETPKTIEIPSSMSTKSTPIVLFSGIISRISPSTSGSNWVASVVNTGNSDYIHPSVSVTYNSSSYTLKISIKTKVPIEGNVTAAATICQYAGGRMLNEYSTTHNMANNDIYSNVYLGSVIQSRASYAGSSTSGTITVDLRSWLKNNNNQRSYEGTGFQVLSGLADGRIGSFYLTIFGTPKN